MPAIVFSRLIGPVPIDVIVSEKHESSLSITENPIETGAKVNDHAVIDPKRLALDFADANAVSTWQSLKRFQESRVPFNIVTGFDVYRNMLIKNLSVERDKTFSTVIRGTADLQEVIIVETSYAANEEGDDTGNASKGNKETRANKPSPSRSNNSTTADKAAGTVQRGDAPAVNAPTSGNSPGAVQNRSILKGILG